jgi:tetratricopeptide (TPR) repeat protein
LQAVSFYGLRISHPFALPWPVPTVECFFTGGDMMNRYWLSFLCIVAFSVIGFASSQDSIVKEADQYLASKDYTKAAGLYQQALASDKTSPQLWFKLGQCYQELGEDQKALDAYDQAEKNHLPPTSLYFRRSRLFAKLGQKDKALELLNSLVSLGFSNPDRIKSEKDFASVQSDSRFAELLKKMDQNAHPCDGPEFRNFDFWVGEWDVTATGSAVASSSIQKILNDCVILENYSSFSGYAGKSFNSYDPQKKEWQQYWIDSAGSSIEFHGKYADGQLVYESDSVNPDGTKIKRKMTFVKLSDNQVRQFSVQTKDGGKTWTPEYDLLYTRKRTPSAAQ